MVSLQTEQVIRSIASRFAGRGKSGQHRAPYFLTGRFRSGGAETASATENNRPDYCRDKGENVR